MLDDIKKSVQLVLHDRITSPLSGAICISWIAWNWRIFYVLFFSDSSFSLLARLQYINQYIDQWYTIYNPIISALIIVFCYPWATTAALYASLNYKKIQNKMRNTIENAQLLTHEESMQIRLLVQRRQDEYNRLLKEREDEINLLKSKIEQIEKQLPKEPEGNTFPSQNGRERKPLSELATNLLLAASAMDDGEIRKSRDSTGTALTAGKTTYNLSKRRDEAKIDDAINELVNAGFVNFDDDSLHTLRTEGFDEADRLQNSIDEKQEMTPSVIDLSDNNN